MKKESFFSNTNQCSFFTSLNCKERKSIIAGDGSDPLPAINKPYNHNDKSYHSSDPMPAIPTTILFFR